MSLFMDIAHDSVNKVHEELCGDNVEIRINDESIIVVLADGLGSGVKANILATMTSTITATMLEEKMGIMDVLETLEETLPKCKVRNLAYSTFTIVQVFRNRTAYILEFDNPPLIFIRDGEIIELDRKPIQFQEKSVFETTIKIEKDDILAFFSDGVIHAGIGNLLNFGWQWEEASDYILARTYENKNAKEISMALIDTCYNLYGEEPGDDTTAVVIRAEERSYLTIFSGPPLDKSKDAEVKRLLDKARGKKIICGGTAGNIVSREYGEEIEIDLSTISDRVPPVGYMKGVDLVTEGVLTIRETVHLLKEYLNNRCGHEIFEAKNGASMLANYLINKCTTIDIIMGNSINPDHQNPDFPEELTTKWRITQELIDLLRCFNKEVNIVYV
ncbi:SpoIIE family protein phosphatase [Acetobacterium tundrae]|uniref:SpoIIE family protein phosphatase n=1 Tax=Acetobacterium tundrae TaxID=132932 RepID=A0ABR6WHK1_9FIRM|nr:SpoIIE family protein phosphatase [Acetobacterium tundrae]MBC3795701.1 SpoIIE family protein phosphatase [Acetobacterium tundrae]